MIENIIMCSVWFIVGMIIGYRIRSSEIKLFKKSIEIDRNKNLIRPQDKSNHDLIVEAREPNNMIKYKSNEEYLKFFNTPIDIITVEKRTEKLFFEVKEIKYMDKYTHEIIFRNNYMILLKIKKLIEENEIYNKYETKYRLIWREIE